MKPGKVFLVGAGPGNPDLITVKGLRLIQSADVILHDRLIPHELLSEAPSCATIINVGKDPHGNRYCPQEEINRLMVHYAQQGKSVVRLKGGDPFIFGRGSEEALVCFQAAIPFEIVPGVSSVHAVPASAGIPLTHRYMSSSYTVITGHEAYDKTSTSISYPDLVKQNGTIVILMGVTHIKDIVSQLIESGLAPDMPVACIEQGTTDQQRVIVSTVDSLPACMDKAQVQSPAVIVIGEVVTLREQGMQAQAISANFKYYQAV